MTKEIPGKNPEAGRASGEMQESLSYRGRTLYTFGGTSGTGEMAASEFALRGGNVVLFTSQYSYSDSGEVVYPSFDGAMRRMRRRGVDVDLLRPVGANQKNTREIDVAIASLNTPPSDVLLAAAGGIDTFAADFRDHLMTLTTLRRGDDPDKERKIGEGIQNLRQRLTNEWLPASVDDAIALNFTGQIHTIEELARRFGGEFNVIFLNSTFGHAGEGPLHYQSVALKRKTTEWIQEHADEYAQKGIYLSELVAPVIEDTKVGTMILEFMMPFYPEDLQQAIVDTKVTRRDVVEAMRILWDMPIQERAGNPHPFTLFVTRHDGQLVIAQAEPEVLKSIEVSKFPF